MMTFRSVYNFIPFGVRKHRHEKVNTCELYTSCIHNHSNMCDISNQKKFMPSEKIFVLVQMKMLSLKRNALKSLILNLRIFSSEICYFTFIFNLSLNSKTTEQKLKNIQTHTSIQEKNINIKRILYTIEM